MFQYYLFTIIAPIAALFSICTVYFLWQRRSNDSARRLALLMLVIIGWLICNTIELRSSDIETTIICVKAAYIFIATLPYAWLSFSLSYGQRDPWLKSPIYHFFKIIPLLTIFIVWNKGSEHLIWESRHFEIVFKDSLYMIVQYGFWFWVHSVFSYFLVIIGSFIILERALKSSYLHLKQTVLLVIGATLPLFLNLVYILKWIPGFNKDFSSIGFAFSSIIITIALFIYQLFDINPIPRERIVNFMQEGMIVVNNRGNITDINLATQKIFNATEKDIIGKPIQIFLPNWTNLVAQQKLNNEELSLTCRIQLQHRSYNATVSAFFGNSNEIIGKLIILHDVTEIIDLFNEVENLACMDCLVPAYNRRHFFELANKRMDEAKRHGDYISIINFDIDRFKRINDTYGHQAGDEILKAAVELCQKNLRESDIFARFGGEEFVILLPKIAQDQALLIANRLCNKIEEMRVKTQNSEIAITISIGIATMNGKDQVTLSQLINRADQAMYVSKHAGRNQATIWQESFNN
jgi:diguanylate cyclase (GGDEF)-like protein/PAS domain S-box-containing protein